jgi:alcohol dehydrogenase class IV
VSSSQAARALTMLARHLEPSLDASALDARLQCQTAAWMSVQGIAYAGLGLSHALGHQIGPRWDVAHGVTSCITLPPAMRAIARTRPDLFGEIAGALVGIPFESNATRVALACADAVAALVARLGLPSSLSSVGVKREELESVASVVHDVMSHHGRVGHAVTLDDVRAVLDAAF